MMKVIKYLNACITDSPEDTLQELKDELGIRFTHNPEYPELYVLGYSQIDSPKAHPIVMECRSLVVEFVRMGEWKVVSRCFDRFFNLGERGIEQDIEMSEMTAFEKLDGSVISLFHHDGYGWLYRTKSMIMPTDAAMESGVLWKDLIEKAFGEVFMSCFPTYYVESRPECTFILELTSPENRIVTKYDDASITLLAIRNNETGDYVNQVSVTMMATKIGWNRPSHTYFDSIGDSKSAADNLPNLEEGFVLYDRYGCPRAKVKSKSYVSAHYMRGECNPTPRRILRMIEENEVDEFLTIFPEYTSLIEPHREAYESARSDTERLYNELKSVEDPKERASELRGVPVSSFVFKRLQGISFDESFEHATTNHKLKLLRNYYGK